MRGWWLVLGSVGVLLAGYAADRLLYELSISIGAYPGMGFAREQSVALAFAVRLLALGWLLAAFVAVRGGTLPGASAVVAAIGVLVGIVPPLLVGLHFALQPEGLSWVYLNDASDPVWSGRTVFTPWIPIGLAVVGIVGVLASRGYPAGTQLDDLPLVVGAALLVGAAYAMDALWQAAFIQLAEGLDGCPAFMVVGLGMRLAVMVAFVVLLTSVWAEGRHLAAGIGLTAIGIVVFVVLPVIGLSAPGFPDPAPTSLAAQLDPGTTATWMAGAVLVAGIVALVRSYTEVAATPARGVVGREAFRAR